MSRSKLQRLAVATLATAGIGLLGTSVQGIAAADDDLARATEQVLDKQTQKRGDGRLCPRKPGQRSTQQLSLDS